MKTTLVGAMLLVAANAQAAPDDPTYPVPDDPIPTPSNPIPTPTDPDPTDNPPPDIPAPPPAPIPTVDPTPQAQPAPITNVTVVDPSPREEWWSMRSAGFALTAGGGVQGFVGGTMRNTTQDGGNWDVRAAFGTRLPVTLEASYLGSAQAINSFGLDNDALLVGNGIQGDLRINATTGDTPIQPFLFGGVAWRRYQLSNTSENTSDVIGEDNVLELPVGVGIAYKMNGMMLEARGEYRSSFYSNLVPDSGSDAFADPASLDRWGVNANIGVEF